MQRFEDINARARLRRKPRVLNGLRNLEFPDTFDTGVGRYDGERTPLVAPSEIVGIPRPTGRSAATQSVRRV